MKYFIGFSLALLTVFLLRLCEEVCKIEIPAFMFGWLSCQSMWFYLKSKKPQS